MQDESSETDKSMPTHEQLLQEFHNLAHNARNADVLMQAIAKRLHETMSRYNWVGFYLVDPADDGVLLIGPYMGSFTPNPRIPLNTGLCGAAASTGQTVVVNDVSEDKRYLAGSSIVKSEIVVPIFAARKLNGELDVESYFAGTFTEVEQNFVEACADVVAKYLVGQ
jgi:L-methionine (R)-S-oxide reductase